MRGEVLERKRTRNSRAISRYSGATFRNSGAIPRSAPPCNDVHLHVFAFTISRTYLPRKLEHTFVYQWVLQELFHSLS